MTAASTYSPSTSCSTMAASSIHGTGAQNLLSAVETDAEKCQRSRWG